MQKIRCLIYAKKKRKWWRHYYEEAREHVLRLINCGDLIASLKCKRRVVKMIAIKAVRQLSTQSSPICSWRNRNRHLTSSHVQWKKTRRIMNLILPKHIFFIALMMSSKSSNHAATFQSSYAALSSNRGSQQNPKSRIRFHMCFPYFSANHYRNY